MTNQEQELSADPPQVKRRVARRMTMISGIAVLFVAGVAAIVLAADALLLVFACILCAILLYKLSDCLLYTSPSPRDRQKSRMPSSA